MHELTWFFATPGVEGLFTLQHQQKRSRWVQRDCASFITAAMSATGKSDAGVTQEDEPSSLADLPEDFLRVVLALLSTSPRSVCALALTCRELRRLSLQCWQAMAAERWMHGWDSNPRWRELQQQGKHQQVYAERNAVSRV